MMPRIGRLHISGGCYHLIGRGLERRYIFDDDSDKLSFLSRLGENLARSQVQCLAWAIMSNHYHLLVRVGTKPLSKLMAPVLGGYAGYYNRRHHRSGYVFQNRYKSILCDEDSYLLELIRYIHLNPLRARMLESLEELDKYAWTGHAGLLGKHLQPWHCTEEVLCHFGNKRSRSRLCYRQFVKEGLNNEARRNYSGGGLIRSYDGWETLNRMRSEHEHCIGDERILGSSEFVERVISQDEIGIDLSSLRQKQGWNLDRLVQSICHLIEISELQLFEKARTNKIAQAKSLICYWGNEELGLTLQGMASRLKISQQAVAKWKKKGQAHCEETAINFDDLEL